MGPKLLAAVLFACVAAATATAAPTARFTPRPIQGPICLAPCAVHFDAIGNGSNETTDTFYTRTFHSLLYQWDFGDPGSGTWAVSGVDKNTAVGAMAGHVYERAGSYLVTLRVTNPAGELSTTTRSVNVVDPQLHFSAANTFCFANSAGNWAGCPLNCAGGDDNCTVTSDWIQASTQGDNCVGASDCANADAGPRRILLRRGDRFRSATQSVLSSNLTSPGLVQAFGSGANPIIENGNRYDWGTGWTMTGIDVNGGQTLLALNYIDNLTFYKVNSVFSQTCIEEAPIDLRNPSVVKIGRQHAFVEVNCTGNGSTGYSAWPGSDYTIWMGGTFDKRGGTDSSLRAHHMQHYILQHTRWTGAAPGREHWQFRTYDELSNPTPEQEQARWVLISDNVVENPGSNNFYSVRTCVDSGCNCGEGSPQCGGASIGAGKIVNVQDFIFERNFFKYLPDGQGNRIGVFELQGGDMTIRNNVVDYQGALRNGNTQFVSVTGEPIQHTSGHSASSNHQVYNNTIYINTPFSSRFEFAGIRGLTNGVGCQGGCMSKNNLLVAPGFTGTIGNYSTFQSSNNVVVSSNPFVGAIPGQGSTLKSNFQLGANAAGVVDAGSTFVATTTRDAWAFDDAFGGCRSGATTGPWDVGAAERGAVRCTNSSQPPPTALLPPTLLAPQ